MPRGLVNVLIQQICMVYSCVPDTYSSHSLAAHTTHRQVRRMDNWPALQSDTKDKSRESHHHSKKYATTPSVREDFQGNVMLFNRCRGQGGDLQVKQSRMVLQKWKMVCTASRKPCPQHAAFLVHKAQHVTGLFAIGFLVQKLIKTI